ncbi:MAG: ATP-dependent zinc metalloprotease FtsH, partial [Firmicutes bacterium]|nr:ATP-dependent zinc metalloprotease FtsH [Bacillota bacterium]
MRNISLYIIVFFTIIVILMAIRGAAPQTEAVVYTYGDLIADIANGRTSKIAKLEVTRDTDISGAAQAKVYFTDNTNITVQIPSVDVFMGVLRDASGLSYDTMPTPKTSWLMQYVPMLVITLLSILLLMFLMQQMQGGGGNRIMSFGRSKAKVNADDKNKITFAQVAGLEEEKAELAEIVEFLRAPKKFTDIGARIPKGVLLVGPPGTGKTYLARAVSGEAGVPYFSISGSDFVEMFVGVGASRVRDLFDQAKKSSPCVIFIDEIDAVGRRRGAGLGGGHDEREQTLNQLLVEMDGFGVNEGIIIIAATNRPDILDPALLRPGRFDRQIVVGKPDVKGREAVLRIHAKGKSIGPDVDFAVVAHSTAGFTPADLENMLNEAAILAARENKTAISMEDIRKAFIKVGVGTEKKSRVISDKEKRITAYHEAGHAIIHEVMSELDPTYIVSIIPTGMAGGYNVMLPGEDKSYHTKRYMEQEISAFMGGRVAEAL